MRYGLRCVVAVAVLWGVTAIGAAAEPAPSKKADTQPAASKSDAPTPAQLRVRMHRTLAALIEAQSAEQPDQAKIDKLTKQLENLRKKIWAGGPAMGRFGAGQCPWGGPRMGYGRGGPGNGYGPGKGYGRGGPGKGYGRGYGPGPGYGRGYGPGPGYGRGAGNGPGGPGYGYGRGMGRQWGFVDKDQDGVCDNFPKPQPKK